MVNEPKRRGRPPKAKVDPLTAAVQAISSNDPPVVAEAKERVLAQAYAMRVWSSQSPSVTRAEKIRRCAEALKDQNLPTEGVEYPEGL